MQQVRNARPPSQPIASGSFPHSYQSTGRTLMDEFQSPEQILYEQATAVYVQETLDNQYPNQQNTQQTLLQQDPAPLTPSFGFPSMQNNVFFQQERNTTQTSEGSDIHVSPNVSHAQSNTTYHHPLHQRQYSTLSDYQYSERDAFSDE